MVLFPAPEPAEAVIAIHSPFHISAPVIGQGRCPPGIDMGHPDPQAVCLVRHYGLHILGPPKVELLLIPASLLPLPVKMFEDDHMRT